RGLEMFGNERGGETAVAFGFKDRNNGTAQSEYYNEVREVLELINVEIAKAKVKDLSAPDARTLVREVQDTGERMQGVAPEDLLFAPDMKFFRARGLVEIVFMPFDVHGEMLVENGKQISREQYRAYLRTVLSPSYLEYRDFQMFVLAMLGRE